MTDADWFDVCTGPDLMQGDILLGCGVLRPRQAEGASGPTDIEAYIDVVDVIIVTQSCDLEQGKVDNVLLAKVDSYDSIVAQSVREQRNDHIGKAGKKFRENCIRNNFPNYSLLKAFAGTPPLPWSLVDFRALYILPKGIAAEHALKVGDRLRLRSPYREHLSQAFARYIMRVGLPTGATEFEGYVSPSLPG